MFKNFRTKKKEIHWIKTLDDCKKYYLENHDYRYVVVVGKQKLPYSICRTLEDAKDSVKSNYMNGGKLPIEIIDLLYEF